MRFIIYISLSSCCCLPYLWTNDLDIRFIATHWFFSYFLYTFPKVPSPNIIEPSLS